MTFQKGSKNVRWVGGKTVRKNGYAFIYKPDHPFAQATGYVAEHRLVMEEHLGRYLGPEEHVHHINGDPSDNRLENLVVLFKSQHHKKHHKEKKENHRKSKVYQEAVRLYESGLSCKEVAEKLGYKTHTINKWLRQDGITRTLEESQKLRREKDVEERKDPMLEDMINMYQQGMSCREIGEKVGKSGSMISHILRREGITRDPLEAQKVYWEKYWKSKV